MKVLELIQEIALGIAIAILIPFTVYWGVSVVRHYPAYPEVVLESTDLSTQSPEPVSLAQPARTTSATISEVAKDPADKGNAEAAGAKANQEAHRQWTIEKESFNQLLFYCSSVVALSVIVVGAFVAIQSLSIGLIAGGVVLILQAMVVNPNSPLVSFLALLSMFCVVVVVAVKRKRVD